MRWWGENVRLKGGPDGFKTDVAERGHRYSVEEAEAATEITKQTVSRWGKLLAKPEYRTILFNAACKKALLIPPDNHRAEGTGENEWFTPPEYIAAAPEMMGFGQWRFSGGPSLAACSCPPLSATNSGTPGASGVRARPAR